MIRFEIDDGIGIIVLDRARARNAINIAMAQDIEAAMDRIEADPEIFVGIIAGSNGVFCSGGDLAVIGDGRADELATPRGGFAGLIRRHRRKPLIAACDGPAIAGGAEIVLACDLVVASTATWFSFPEVARGLVAGAGGAIRLPLVLPRSIALDLLITGAPISAERAHQFGWVGRLCEPGQALEVASGLARQICQNAPLAVRETLAILAMPLAACEDDAFDRCDKARSYLSGTEDFSEGVRAFLEKRKPVWRAR